MPPEKIFPIAIPAMQENVPLQYHYNEKIPNDQDSKLWGGQGLTRSLSWGAVPLSPPLGIVAASATLEFRPQIVEAELHLELMTELYNKAASNV